jgi:hypothetical protein
LLLLQRSSALCLQHAGCDSLPIGVLPNVQISAIYSEVQHAACIMCWMAISNWHNMPMWDAAVQCHLFEFAAKRYGREAAAQLNEKLEKLHILTVDVGYAEAEHLPANIHYVPFATNLHYVPEHPGRSVAIAASYGGGWDGGMYSGRPPARRPWRPARIAQHKRPILASYIGFSSRKPGWERLKNELGKEGWRLKDAVRLHAGASVKSLNSG